MSQDDAAKICAIEAHYWADVTDEKLLHFSMNLKAAEQELAMPDLFSTLSTGSEQDSQVFNREEVSQPDAT